MNQNNLVDGIETQMKIEKGLKLLEFASHFYARRAYLRNCPLNVDQAGTNNQNNGEIMAQLNQFLVDPEAQVQRRNAPQMADSPPSMMSKKMSDKESNSSPQSSRVNAKNSKGLESVPKQKVEESDVTPKKVVKALVDMAKPKSVKFAQKVVQKLGSEIKEKKEMEQSAAKLEAPPSVEMSQDSLPQYQSSQESIGKMRKFEDSQQIGKSNSSYTKPLDVIKEHSHESSVASPDIKVPKGKEKPQGYDLSDFASIKNDTSVASKVSAKSFKKQSHPQSSFSCQFPSRLQQNISKQSSLRGPEPKSESKSFLDKSISQIKSSKERQSFITNSKLNQTQLHILRELSDSYIDDENMKNLMKLENMEMQEKYLLNRMERRFEKCAKQIDQIRHITWQGLRMPQRDIQFKRPNYAHCLQGLK